jgi:MFS family permease
MNRKISVGDSLNEVFSIYGAQAGVLLPIAFWIYLVVAVLTGIASGSVGLLLIALVASLLAGVLYQGIVVSLVRDVQDGRRDYSMGDLIGQATPFLAPLLGAGILAALGIAVGFVLLVVPGLILLTIWAVIAPVIVIEKSGAIDSFRRSRELVRGNGWPVFGTLIVAFLIVFVAGAILSSIALAITDGVILQIVFSALASTVTAPITALVAAVLYYRLLAIQGPPPVAPSGTSLEDLPPPADPPADPPAPAPPTPGT